jgi:hypothetical protein
MRQRPVHRAFAALLLLWFAAVVAEPAALHACPVHDPLTLAAAEPHAASGGDHGAAHADPTHQAPGHGDAPHQCLCIGDCAASAPPAVLAAGSTVLAVVVLIDGRVALPQIDSPRGRAPAFLLPYPNGPPAASRVA